MQVILPVIYALLFIFLILKTGFFKGTLPGIQLAGLFCLKIIAGVTAHYIYVYYYPHSDAYLFMEGSRNVFDQFMGRSSSTEVLGWNSSFDDNFYNSSRIIIFINFIIQFLSFDNVFVHILFFCFFSFVGLTALYKAFHKHFPGKRTALVIGVYLVPSVLFWTSGIYKEGLAILCIGLIVYHSDFGLAKTYAARTLALLVLFVILLFFLKLYILICLFPPLLINAIVSKTGERNFLLKYGLCFLLFVLIFHMFSKISPRTNFYQLLADRQAKAISQAEGGIFLEDKDHFLRLNYNDSAALVPAGDSLYFIKDGTSYMSWQQNNMKDTTYLIQNSGMADPVVYKLVYKVKPANSVIRVKKMDPDFVGLLKNVPGAIANVFFQPTLFSIQNALQMFSWLENIWLLLLIAFAVLFYDKQAKPRKEIFLFCILFALFQFAMIGLTNPVVGAIVRYKVTALPFLFTLCLLCIDHEKLMKRISRKKDSDSYTE